MVEAMDLETLYERAGGALSETLRRIPSEAMLRRFILKYREDTTCVQLRAAVEERDWETAFRAAHTLKGVAQNLGFESLYRVSAELTEALRGGKPLTRPELLTAVEAQQQTLLRAIEALES